VRLRRQRDKLQDVSIRHASELATCTEVACTSVQTSLQMHASTVL
jgi:hypothetical protein